MANCGYPRCPNEAGVDVIPARKEFCKTHERVQCFYGNARGADGKPMCEGLVVPGSGWCKVHDAVVQLFDFVHALRHQENQQKMMAARQTQDIVAKLKGNGGGLIVPGR